MSITNSQSPNTPTTPEGQELINNNSHQGKIVSDGTNDRVVLGYQKDGFGTGVDYGIKVSQAGYDVRTATDDQLAMSSAFNMFKIVQSGTATLTVPASMASTQVASTTVTHNLGYKPAFDVYITDGTAYGLTPGQNQQTPFIQWYIVAGSIRGMFYTTVSTSTTTITFKYINGTTVTDVTGGYITFKYYLFRETAS